ncbi:MAG: hypothetical protein ACTSVR_08395 [Candidatus Thorarchaeota archaeon]
MTSSIGSYSFGASFDEIIYNGFVFPVIKTKKFKEEYVYDDSGDTIKYNRISITIECILEPNYLGDQPGISGSDYDGTLTPLMDRVRAWLSVAGQELILVGTGFGDIVVNPRSTTSAYVGTPDRYFDMENGPKPKILHAEPIGRDQVFRIVWEVTTTIPKCFNQSDGSVNTVANAAVVSFDYTVGHTVQEDGTVVRTTEGQIEVPRYWRNPDASITPGTDNETAEQTSLDTSYRTEVYNRCNWLKTHLGMKRSQDWSWSLDRRFYQFRITDTEIPSDNPLFPGTVDMDLVHSVKSSLIGSGNVFGHGAGFSHWIHRLSGSVTLAPGSLRVIALWAFLDVFRKRTEGLNLRTKSSITRDGVTVDKSRYFILEIQIDEHIHRRMFKFSVKWLSFMDLTEAIDKGGANLFKPATTSSWEAHRQNKALDGSYDKPRRQQVVFKDINREMCSKGPDNKAIIKSDKPSKPVIGAFEGLMVTKPTKQLSYTKYKNKTSLEEESNLVPHRRQKSLSEASLEDHQHDINVPDEGKVENIEGADKDETLMQVRGTNEYRVIMGGYALRIGYRPTPPILLSYGGADAIREGGEWMEEPIASSAAYPMFAAAWRVTYLLKKRPTTGVIVYSGDPGSYT